MNKEALGGYQFLRYFLKLSLLLFYFAVFGKCFESRNVSERKRQNKRHGLEGPGVGRGRLFSKLLRERETDLTNPTTTAEGQLEARPRRPRSAGRPGCAAGGAKRRRRRGRHISTQRRRGRGLHLHGKRPEHACSTATAL